MTNLMKRSLALLMALFLCLSLLPATAVPVHAAEYTYNWGARGVTATELSDQAEAFYTGNNTYDALSTLAGGTSKDNVPNSNLYKALQNLMKDAHSYETSYDATRDLYQYTDCQNGGGKISSFYSGAEIGPDWDGGDTWNREHTWPNSKGLGGNDENDIMMLRPTSVSENSSRGNAAYGESGGYYDPNSESGGALNLHGDVARIFLYVYVRWGNTNGNGEYATWGTNGVIESPEVMLKWMAEDPVDTWEMGRNDSVQSITGTRNVFVDYPELAFKLFGEEVPTNMTTPSGKADSTVEPDVPVVEPEEEVTVAPQTVELTIKATTGTLASDKSSIAWENSGVSFTNRKASSTSAIRTSDADHFRVYAHSAVDFAAPGNITQIVVTCTSASYATVLATSAGSEATVSGSVVTIIPTASATTYTIADITAQTRVNKVAITYEVSGEVEVCQHTNTTTTTVDATCTEDGSTTVTCVDCGETVSTTVISAPGHNYVDGTCSACGEADPSVTPDEPETPDEPVVPTEATITFDDTAKRTEFTTSKQVWVENGITVTNDKAASTTNVGDYSNPARFYANSNLTIEYPGMTQIVIDTSGSKYVAPYQSSITDPNATVSVDGNIVTVTFAEPVDVFVITKLSAQARATSITVTAAAAEETPDEPACEHTNTKTTTIDATCTEDGSTTVTCDDCKETVSTTVIPALGHSYVDGTCSACGEADPSVTPDEPATGLEEGVAYTISANNADGTLWFNGTVTSGRFNGSYNESEAVSVYVENVDGGFLMYFMDGTTKQYICIADKAAGGSFSTDAATATVFEWNADKSTAAVAEDSNNRAFGCSATSTYTNFSAYDLSGDYNWGQFIADSDETPCEHTNRVTTTVDATCGKDGSTTVSCADCGHVFSTEAIPATGEHSYKNHVCTVCHKVDLAADSELTLDVASAIGAAMEHNTYTEDKYYVTGEITEVANETYGNMYIVDEAGNTLYIYGVYDGDTRYDALETKPVAGDTVKLYGIIGSYNDVAQMKNAQLIEHEVSPCEHTNTTVEGAKDASCTEEGYTGDTVCQDCGVTIKAGEVIAAGHKYVDGACSACGEKEPLIATITFDDTAKRTEYSTTIQVWEENGITVTNDKAASTTNVADYFKPARFYKGSDLKIEYPNMTQIVIDCTGLESKYVTAYESIEGATVENGIVTISFAQPVNEYVITNLSAQARANSITVAYAKVEEEPVCEEHSFVDGVCSGCGHKLGDINGDGTVTYQDAVYLLLANMFPEYTLDGVYADVNGDGIIDVNDAVYLLLHVLFGDLFYPLRTTVVG